MTARIATVAGVRRHGEKLTIVTVKDGEATHEVVANLQDDGTPRWTEGETVVYVTEGSIVPEDVMKERGYWNEERGRGYLDGNRHDRVKMRRMGGYESRGLLFKTRQGSFMGESITYVDRQGHPSLGVLTGQDVSGHLGIVDHGA
jgi:tRNA-binding EMAP/Myf-like protein